MIHNLLFRSTCFETRGGMQGTGVRLIDAHFIHSTPSNIVSKDLTYSVWVWVQQMLDILREHLLFIKSQKQEIREKCDQSGAQYKFRDSTHDMPLAGLCWACIRLCSGTILYLASWWNNISSFWQETREIIAKDIKVNLKFKVVICYHFSLLFNQAHHLM